MGTSQILLVDDEPMVLSSLKRLLEEDYIVYTCQSGYEAIEKAQKYPIKVVISDQRMPVMLGHEVLRRIKQVNPNAVRMLLTGYSDLDAVIGSVNAGEIFRYINKPWKSDNLISLVKLGVRIYDRVSSLQVEESKKPTLPVMRNSPAPSRAVHIEVEEKSPSVLFVDYSEGEVSKLVNNYSKSFDVSGATSVDEAFKALSKKPVSVIVSNVNFSDVDGISFLNAVRKEYPHIVTVILTEVKDATLAVRSINELNAFKYLVKPDGEHQLDQTLQDAVSRNKAQQAQPLANVRATAEEISPDLAAPKEEESALRLRLRAAQALLAKK